MDCRSSNWGTASEFRIIITVVALLCNLETGPRTVRPAAQELDPAHAQRALMNRLIECVPNFSEGRDAAKVDQIVSAMSGIPGAWILDRTSDADHNRSVITLAGAPEAVAEAVLRGAGEAARLIDMTAHKGVHPRIGATDVIPFVPLENVSLEECVALARHVGRQLWERYRIPVYFYEAAATRPERVNLENVRKGQFENLLKDAMTEADRAPDIGEPRLHPTAGITAVGARNFLIAYNIYLNTSDVSVAREIARVIRYSNGGLRNVKAIGVEMKTRHLAQVSINLTNFEQTPLHHVFDAVQEEAEKRGCKVVSSEIIGLVPRKALAMSAGHNLELENFSFDRVLENRLAAVTGILPMSPEILAISGPTLGPIADSLREAIQSLSGRAIALALEGHHGSSSSSNPHHALNDDIQSYLDLARGATEIYERLGQLESASVPPTQLDWVSLKQATIAAARNAIRNVEDLRPSLQDAGTIRKLNADLLEIEAKLCGKPVTATN
jgi:glutamate formiminotransferase